MLPWHETCNSSCYLFKFNDQTRPAFSNESASCYICLLHQFLGFNFFKILYNNSCQNSIFADLSNNIVYLTLTSLLVHHQHRYPSIFPVHLHHAQLLFCSITLLSSPNSLFFIYLFYHPYHRPSIYKNLSHWQSVSTVWVWHIHTHTHTLSHPIHITSCEHSDSAGPTHHHHHHHHGASDPHTQFISDCSDSQCHHKCMTTRVVRLTIMVGPSVWWPDRGQRDADDVDD